MLSKRKAEKEKSKFVYGAKGRSAGGSRNRRVTAV